MKRIVISTLAIAAVLASGLVHGIWTGRWEISDEPGDSASRLPNVSMDLGDWHGQTLDAESRLLSGASAVLCRRYAKEGRDVGVTVFLLCGRPGPVAIHPPDSCYAAGGYEVASPTMFTASATLGTPPPEFRVARMRKRRANGQTQLRVFWAWNDGKGWRVPADPRLEYASSRVLFKLYLVRELADFDEALGGDPCTELMNHLLPELDKVLFVRS